VQDTFCVGPRLLRIFGNSVGNKQIVRISKRTSTSDKYLSRGPNMFIIDI
jgi:hypothetical protein